MKQSSSSQHPLIPHRCRFCNAEMRLNEVFCPNCGRQLTSVPQLSRQMIQQPGKQQKLANNQNSQPNRGAPPFPMNVSKLVRVPPPHSGSVSPAPMAPQPPTIQLPAKTISAPLATFLLSCLFTVGIGVFFGVVLNGLGKLPAIVAIIAGSAGGILTLIATALSAIVTQDSIGKAIGEICKAAHRFWAGVVSLLIVVILTLLTLLIPMMTFDPYIHQGQVGLNDPLTNQSQYHWQDEKDCLFKEGAYHVRHTGKYSNTICQTTAYKNLRDFVYEVEVKIIQGDHAGIVFRIDASKYNYYKFIVAPSGKYRFEARENYGLKDTLAIGMAPSNGVDYKIAAVAQGSTITVYVNQQIVVSKKIISNDLDSAIISGQIGVIAGCDDYPLTAEAIFSNAKVWEL